MDEKSKGEKREWSIEEQGMRQGRGSRREQGRVKKREEE